MRSLHKFEKWISAWSLGLIRISALLCGLALVALMSMVTLNIVTRSLFNRDLQVTDELSGYLLVTITFLSFAVSFYRGALFRVEILFSRLSPNTQTSLNLIFELASLAVIALLDYQLIRFVVSTYKSGNVAPTFAATPLYIPQLAMPLGMTILLVIVIASILRNGLALRNSKGE